MSPLATSTTAIWNKLSDDLRRFIRSQVSNQHLADDLLQETFLRIHRSLDKLQDADRLTSWVYQISRNVIRDQFRKSPKNLAALEDLDIPNEAPPPVPAHGCQPGPWIQELVNQIPEGYREAVWLAEWEGRTQQEIADQLGLSLSGAKSRVQRGRALVREALEQCCSFEFDRRGNLTAVDPLPSRTVCRGCAPDEPSSFCINELTWHETDAAGSNPV